MSQLSAAERDTSALDVTNPQVLQTAAAFCTTVKSADISQGTRNISQVVSAGPVLRSMHLYQVIKLIHFVTLSVLTWAASPRSTLTPFFYPIPWVVQGIQTVCEIRGVRRGQTDPLKSMRDPCKVVICRDPGGSNKNPLIVNCLSYYLI